MELLQCPKCGCKDYQTELVNIHLKSTCKSCGAFIKFLSQGNKIDKFPFGKYKDQLISECQDKPYFIWLTEQTHFKLGGALKNAIIERLKNWK